MLTRHGAEFCPLANNIVSQIEKCVKPEELLCVKPEELLCVKPEELLVVNRFELTPMKAFLKHRKEFFVIDDAEQYKRVTVRLHAGGIVLRDEVYGSQLRTKKQQATKAGDLLVAEIDAKVGGVGIVPPELAGAIVSSHYFLYEIDETICHPKYLEYYIRSGAVEKQFQEFVRGSTNYASIRAYHTLELQIPLLSLDEQRRIVARIEELAALIEEAQGLRAKAREEAEALSPSVLQGVFDDLSKRLGLVEIGSFADVKGGKRLPRGERLTDSPTPFPYIRVSDMRHHSVDLSGLKYVPEHIHPQIARYTISAEDVYVTIAGTIGYPGLVLFPKSS